MGLLMVLSALHSRHRKSKAIMVEKNGKAVGPDLIPNEILKAIARCDASLDALCSFFNEIVQSGSIPEDWDKSVATLIPKLSPSSEANHLRPITLSSHVAKTFARMLLGRMESDLRPRGPKQFACAGRQPAEMASLATHVVHLSGSGKQTAIHSSLTWHELLRVSTGCDPRRESNNGQVKAFPSKRGV